MNLKRILGLAAVAGLLVMAAPAERAQAVSLSNPGIAAAVQDETGKLTTEVRYYHHYGYHHRWHHQYHWRHHHYWRRHYWHRHHWHHHYWHHHYGHRHHWRHHY